MINFFLTMFCIFLIAGFYDAIKNNGKRKDTTGISIITTHPYNNDYVSFRVKYKGEFIRFDIAGANYRRGLDKCLGEFEGTLIREPTNKFDSEAIKIIHENGTHVGYVPRNYNGDRVRFEKSLPCKCHCILRKGEKGYFGIAVVPREKPIFKK